MFPHSFSGIYICQSGVVAYDKISTRETRKMRDVEVEIRMATFFALSLPAIFTNCVWNHSHVTFPNVSGALHNIRYPSLVELTDLLFTRNTHLPRDRVGVIF
jgi:hypothetical protein